MDRAFERAFNKAHAKIAVEINKTIESDVKQSEPEPEDAPCAIKRILESWESKQYFRLLLLPEPTADELGRPLWPCTNADVSRAYRKLSVLVHPDKNPGEDARKAFEVLNEAHRMLKDAGRLEEILREAAVRARREKERAEAMASGDARVALNASKNAAARQLRKEEGLGLQNEIVQQMKRRQEEARRRAQALATAKVAQLHQQEQQGSIEPDNDRQGQTQQGKQRGGQQRRGREDDSDGDRGRRGAGRSSEEDSDEEAERRRQALRKKKKPTFLH